MLFGYHLYVTGCFCCKFFKGQSCKVNCNLQPDEWTVWPATNIVTSTLWLVRSMRYRPGFMHVGKIPLQLQQCMPDHGAVSWVGSNCLPKSYWHGCGMEQKTLFLPNQPIYSVFQLYLSTWFRTNDWSAGRSSVILLWAFIILKR